MDRIEAIPGPRCRNHRDFSPLTDRREPIIDFTDEHARVGQRKFATRKKYPAEELKSSFAESFDAVGGQLRDNRRRADLLEPIEASLDPIKDLTG